MTTVRAAAPARTDYVHWQEIATRWMDNDVYGHVNNVVYYAYFDTVVNAWLIERGLLDIAQGPIIGLVVETSCRYFAPVAFPDVLAAGLKVTRVGTSAVHYAVGLFRADASAAAAAGNFVHVYVDRITRRPVPLPDSWRTALATLAN